MHRLLEALPTPAEVLAQLIAWGNAQPDVRAMILTSSLARPDGPVDRLSDADVIFAVTEAERFGQDDGWVSAYGTPMVSYYDAGEREGLTTYSRCVLYEDYVKIDYSIWPTALLHKITQTETLPEELDAGYRVLLDKDGNTADWPPPSYRGYVPVRPTDAQYQALIREFWFSATYVAKSLWREELVFARWVLDQEMRDETLRPMLEWRMEIDHAWSLRPGVFGRGLKDHLHPDLWSELERTYVGPEWAENWAALFALTALFRRAAGDVGRALGFAYPQELDDNVSAYLDAVRDLPPQR